MAQRGEPALMPRRKGRPPKASVEEKEIEKLRRENDRLKKRLEISEAIVELQKKVLGVLDAPEGAPPNSASKP